MAGGLATASWEALGSTALVRVDDPRTLAEAKAIVAAELAAIDLAASRFRSDSELEQVNAHAGRFMRIGALLHEAIAVALRAAERSNGAVDPSLGRAIRLAGYDRDFSALDPPVPESRRDPVPQLAAARAGGWRQIELSYDPPGVLVPAGMALDLGATAKAMASDRAARAVAAATGAGALVSLGGDIAVAGRVPPGGWRIHVTDDHRSGPDAVGQTVAIASGGLATSSTTVRRWRRRDKKDMHHILDPRTGAPTQSPWRTVSVAAASCVDANVAATAAIVLGAAAPQWLADQGLAARLVAVDGRVMLLGGWPDPEAL